MIRRRTVIILGAVTVAASLAAIAAVIDRAAETRTVVETERPYPTLVERAAEVSRVRLIRAPGSQTGTVTLSSTGSGWVVEERDGYPARTDLVRKLLFDLGQIELIERKTADAGRYDRLELKDVSETGSKASRVVVETADGKTLVDLYVGKRRESLTGGEPMVYVRRNGEAQSYLAEGELDLRGGPEHWLPREIVNIPKDSIVSAELTSATGETMRLERAGQDFRIARLVPGRKITSQYTVNNAATVIDKMLFDDVRSAEGLDFANGAGKGVFRTSDGLTVTVELAGAPADPTAEPWLRVDVAASDDATEEARTLAASLQGRVAGWAYRLSSYDLERLRATAESLTKPAEGS